MYLYFNKLGQLKEIINDEALRQGNYNVNKMYVYVEDRPTYTSIDASYLLPNGLVVGPMNYSNFEESFIPFDSKRDLRFFKYNQTYRFCVIDLEADLNGNSPLDQAGTVHCDLAIMLVSYQLALGEVNFSVELNSVLNQKQVASQEYLALSDYQFLRQFISGGYGPIATQEWVENQHYLTSATYDYVNTLTELKQALTDGKKFIVLGSNFNATVGERITIPAGTIIIGNGGTFTRAVGFEGTMFWVNERCELSNFIINGNRSNMVSPTWDSTIEIALFGNCYIHDIQIIDGNEGVIAYGDFNRVEHCKFTNMGGNAVHFSGGECTVVDGCYISGANKRSGMGHEDGCIVWSDECRFINCLNNYCEDGKTGFGAIDTYDNSYVKIVNNTVKNCDNSFDLVTSRDQAVDVLIQGNLIINSGKMEMNKTSRSLTAQARYMICNNMLVKSKIEVSRLDTISILGNMILEGTVKLVACTNIKIENNSIKNFSMREVSLECGSCANVSILGNYVRGDYDVINCYDSTSVIIANNKVRAYSTDNSKNAIHTSAAKYANNNEIISYCNGAEISDGYSFTNNTVYLEDDTKNSILEYYGATYSLIAFNRANGVVTVREDATNENIANMAGDPSEMFLEVETDLTNITSSGLDSVFNGDDYYTVLTAGAGYELPDSISVSMGGDQEVGPNEFLYNKETGELIVFGVTAALTITAAAVTE